MMNRYRSRGLQSFAAFFHRLCAVLPVVALVASPGLILASDYIDWVLDPVDGATPSTPVYSSIAVDAAGDPHVTYYDPTTSSCMYATRTFEGEWTTDVVEPATVYSYLRAPSIAIDSEGRPHIAYGGSISGDSLVIHAYKSNEIWHKEVVCDSTEIAMHPSLVIDALDQIHVVYSRYDGLLNLRHCWKVDDAWNTEIVDQGDLQVVTIDDAGDLHIVYRGWDGLQLQEMRHAKKSGGSWTLDTLNMLGNPTGVATDALGEPHVLFKTGSSIVYSWRNGDSWTDEFISSTELTVETSAIGIDWRGNPVIVFTELGSQRICWFYKWDQEVWHPDIIETVEGACIGREPTFTFNALGHPRVVYYSQNALYYVSGTDLDLPTAAPETLQQRRILLYPCIPNPFHPPATLRFRLPNAEYTTLSICDAGGRTVAELVNGLLPPGSHSVRWHGRDREGRLVGSGVYFSRLVVGGVSQARKLLLLQ